MIESPIFSCTHNDSAGSLRVSYNSNKIGVITDVIKPTGAHIFQSIEDAEDFVLNSSTNVMQAVGGDVRHFGIEINRASSSIAKKTRRGAGNRVFMHPNMFGKIASHPSTLVPVGNPVKIGRWTHWGIANSRAYYTSHHLRKNEAFVLYIGTHSFDVPAFLFDINGQLQVELISSTPNTLGQFDDYIAKVVPAFHLSLWLSAK